MKIIHITEASNHQLQAKLDALEAKCCTIYAATPSAHKYEINGGGYSVMVYANNRTQAVAAARKAGHSTFDCNMIG